MTAAGRAGAEDRGSGTGRCHNLVERAAELELLDRCFDGARRGAGTAVMVCGSAGSGKTSLVEAFLASLDEEETPTVLWSGCDDLIAPRPFGPFRDMIHGNGLLPDELAIEPNQEDLLVSLLGLLDRPSRPAIVVVEDAHWADDASIDVMRYLARRLVSLHAMLIVTARVEGRDDDAGGGHPVRGLLTGSSSSAPVRIDLGPLSLEAVATLGGESHLDARYLHEVSGGNPLLVHQLLAADPDDTTRLARETLMSRAACLSGDGRSALQTLAVLPKGAAPTLIRTLFSEQPGALHEAEGTGLLVSTTSDIRFRHELARTAVLEAMSFGERMVATDRVLAALTDAGEDPKVLVHIARAAGDGPLATRFALDVLDRGLAPNDHPGAWVLSRIALECTAKLPAERVAWLHATAAVAGRGISRHDEAMHHAERAVQLLTTVAAEDDGGSDKRRSATERSLASAWMTLADLQGDAGDHLRARTALRNAREVLDGVPPCEESVRCTTRLAAAALVGGELNRSVELANSAVELAEANAWAAELVHALTVRGLAAGGTATGPGREDLARATELGALHGPTDHHVLALLGSADGYLRGTETADAERVADEAARTCAENGLKRLGFQARVHLAQVLIHRGRTAEAEKLANTLIDETADPAVIDCGAEATLARIMVRRGDEQAEESVERAWSAAVATGEIEKLAFAGISRLEFLWVEGDEETLRQFARYLIGLGDRHRHHRLRAEALRALHRLGDDIGAGDPGEAPAERDWPFEGCPPPFAAALAGDHRLAAELWETAGEPYEQALELIESTEAAAAFQGLRLLDRTGATRTADQARHRLRKEGLQGVPRGPRRSLDGAVPILTGRQIEVLKLIARGLTNAEIADELYVARRTVDNHVSAILFRLGAKGRSQAVDEAVSSGLIDATSA